jgi:hypothetical protein
VLRNRLRKAGSRASVLISDGPVNHILMPEDPAYQRYERLVDALGTGPVHTAFENAAVARIVAWATEEDCTALTRLVRRARRDAFTVGRLNPQQEPREARGGEQS